MKINWFYTKETIQQALSGAFLGSLPDFSKLLFLDLPELANILIKDSTFCECQDNDIYFQSLFWEIDLSRLLNEVFQEAAMTCFLLCVLGTISTHQSMACGSKLRSSAGSRTTIQLCSRVWATSIHPSFITTCVIKPFQAPCYLITKCKCFCNDLLDIGLLLDLMAETKVFMVIDMSRTHWKEALELIRIDDAAKGTEKQWCTVACQENTYKE